MRRESTQFFDLNIGDILDAWQPRHAVREIIANALDEQVLSGTSALEITNEAGAWHIRDFGRGLHFEHLRQDENPEKRANSSRVIGKFGFGLKDALATLHRRGVDVEILWSSPGFVDSQAMPPAGWISIATRTRPG